MHKELIFLALILWPVLLCLGALADAVFNWMNERWWNIYCFIIAPIPSMILISILLR